MKCHPFLYLCLLVTGITVTNIVYIAKSNRKLINSHSVKRYLKPVSVTLLSADEHTILSRIRYMDREASLLYGQHHQHGRPRLVLGIASVARPPGVDYLSKTLHMVLDSMDEAEAKEAVVIVAMMDRDPKVREDRAKLLYRKFKRPVDSGLVQIVAPHANIYPAHNYSLIKRRPFNNTVQRMEWQAKLSLDFAFLFSYCSNQADYFMNLEDDIVPGKHLVNETLKYVTEREQSEEDWSSIQFSKFLSIGRLYRSRDLGKLVDLVLISYTRQPVDYIMHHFDVLQLADGFKEFRRNPPLLTHRGSHSTLDTEALKARVTRKYNPAKRKSPPATVSTNMTAWQGNKVEACYFEIKGQHYFWASQFHAYDVIDVQLTKPARLKRMRAVTGFDGEEERARQDRLVKGQVLFKPTKSKEWTVTGAKVDNLGQINYHVKEDFKVETVRLRVLKGTTDWLVVRLFALQVA